MPSMVKLIEIDVFLFFGVLFAIVAFRLLNGDINTRGLLMRKHGIRRVSPERIQLLLFTLAAASNYLNNVLKDPRGDLPDVSNTWLYLLGGSHATYLGAKAFSVVRSKSKKKKSD